MKKCLIDNSSGQRRTFRTFFLTTNVTADVKGSHSQTWQMQTKKNLYLLWLLGFVFFACSKENPAALNLPGTPTGLISSDITQTSFTLNWTASTDHVGVTGYDVFKNGVLETSVTGTSASITGLIAGTTYSMTLKAKNAAGDVSASSTVLSVTTLSGPDTQGPSTPTGLVSINVTSSSLTLTWTASTDNVGVTGYDVYVNELLATSVTGTSAGITGLTTATTTYSMTVKAKDAAGNISSASTALNVKGWPDASSTGTTGTLTASGPITVTTAGAIIENLDISGKISIKANNVTIRNCKFTSLDIASADSYTGTVVEDCELTWAGRQNYTLRRCEISSQADDLIRLGGTNILIEDCYLHVDGPPVSGNHADAIQLYPGPAVNCIIRHNTIYVLLTSSVAGVINAGGVLIENNLLAGGSYTIYGDNVRVLNNHFSTILFPTCGINGVYYSSNTAAEWTGNVWHETGVTIPNHN
ncbi:MAG: fibronectin type III domain-containing protein [Bacteroidales bacterium]|nr:fibronectin type III domain-containing protein [Bacteroidales bacterium]